MSYYAINKGTTDNVVVNSWSECAEMTQGVSGAVYKKFDCPRKAEHFAQTGEVGTPKTKAEEKQPEPQGEQNVSDGKLRIYTDGSCRTPGTLPVSNLLGWAFVAVLGDTVIYEESGKMEDAPDALRSQANVAAEMKAAMMAARWAHKEYGGAFPFTIVHDYDGIAKWPEGDWKTKNEFSSAYAEYMKRSGASFEWIKGHSGQQHNERADEMARAAAIEGYN